jgi:NAD(P)-dependent dehydrogenase (short-subunit alcohol dehydrogenase family)
MKGWSESDIPDLSGRRVLVTGGASGIGFHACRALAQHGAEVILADRNVPLAEQSVEAIRQSRVRGSIAAKALDLASLAEVRAFAEGFLAEGRPIDILVNNAGIQPIAERRISADGFELTFGIGHLGHFLLTGLLYPLIRAAAAPRVVTVSSMVHGRGSLDWDDLQITRNYASQRAYNQTKLANLLFARELQRRIDAAGDPTMSIAVHPGVARTAIGANRHNLGKLGLADHLVSAILTIVMPLLGQDPDQGALPTLYGATSPDARGGRLYGPSGFGEMKGPPKEARIKSSGQDMAAAARLWTVSEELTGIRFLG